MFFYIGYNINSFTCIFHKLTWKVKSAHILKQGAWQWYIKQNDFNINAYTLLGFRNLCDAINKLKTTYLIIKLIN